MRKYFFTHFVKVIIIALMAAVAQAGEEPDQNEISPLAVSSPVPQPTPQSAFADLWENADLTLGTTYYGRARHADNRGRNAYPHQNEIHVNAFGQRADLRSGYAWGVIGFDVSGQTNLGRGNGWSEVLLHDDNVNKDKSSVFLGQAALKTKIGNEDLRFEARGGYTPISVGSLGTSAGLYSHAYRGFETKVAVRDFWIGYGWADQFRNEWDNTYRDMTNHWRQNRYPSDNGRRISYAHSLGARYEFGLDKAGFVDVGVGEGRRFRKNVQAVVSVPIDLCDWGVLTLTGYGIAAKYVNGGLFNNGQRGNKTEYHVSGLASLKNGDLTLFTGFGHTSAPDSEEMQFRLTAWGNSDNRNFIQTWGQLDDYVWDGQNVVKTGAKYDIGERIRIPGLSVGATFIFAWNGRNHDGRPHKTNAWEVDYNVEYRVREGRLKGLALGVYAGHLRWSNNNFSGKQNRNDVKVIMSYSYTLERFLRRK